MPKFMHFLLILLFSLSPQAYGQKRKLICAEEKKEEPKTCGLKPAADLSDALVELTEKCKEKAAESSDTHYELVGSSNRKKEVEISKSTIQQFLLILQSTIDYFERNLTSLERKIKAVTPDALAEIDKLTKALDEKHKAGQELVKQFYAEPDPINKQKISEEFKINGSQQTEIINKKSKLEILYGIKKDSGQIEVADEFKPQTIDFLKKNLSKLKAYKENLEKGLGQNDLTNPTFIADYDKAVGMIALERLEFDLIAKGQTHPCNLTNTEYYMLNRYTSGRYSDINSPLRIGPTSKNYESAKVQADIINRALDKIAPHEGLVQRGIKNLPVDVEAAHCLGCIVEHQAFTSTSTRQGFSGKYQFAIQSKNGKYVAPVSNHPSEEEVLFKAGARFKILDINKTDTLIKYTMQEVEE